MGLLKFILYAIIIYYCIIFFSRFFLTLVLKRWANKFQKNMKNQANSNNYHERQEGETVVQYKKKTNSTSDPGGEYVDFEDVNEGK